MDILGKCTGALSPAPLESNTCIGRKVRLIVRINVDIASYPYSLKFMVIAPERGYGSNRYVHEYKVSQNYKDKKPGLSKTSCERCFEQLRGLHDFGRQMQVGGHAVAACLVQQVLFDGRAVATQPRCVSSLTHVNGDLFHRLIKRTVSVAAKLDNL